MHTLYAKDDACQVAQSCYPEGCVFPMSIMFSLGRKRSCAHVFDHSIVTGMVGDLCIQRRVHIKLSRCCFERFMLVAFRCGMKSMLDFGNLSCMSCW